MNLEDTSADGGVRTTADPEPRGTLSPPYRAFTLGAVALSTLIGFESLAVTTAMPTAARALDGLALYGLAFGGPLAAGVVAMVLSGAWSDRRGPARPLTAGIGLFVLGLLLAGAAPTMGALVAGRVVQGFGSGLVSVALYVVVGHLYPPALRPKVFTAFAGAWVVPSLVGPGLTGLIVEHAHWRWVFLGVPLLALPAALLLRPALRDLAPRSGSPARPGAGRRVLWALAAAVGAGLLHYGGQQRGALAAVLLATAVTILAGAAPRLLPPGTLRAGRGLPSVIAVRGLIGAAVVGTDVFVPLMLSRERGLSAAAAGSVLTLSALGWFAGSWYQGRSGKRPAPVAVLRLGLVLVGLGVVAVAATVSPGVPVAVAIVGWTVGGIGMGAAYPTLSVLTLELSPPDEQGRNSSALQLADSLTTTAVLALGGSLFAALVVQTPRTAYLAAFAISGVLVLLGLGAVGRVHRS